MAITSRLSAGLALWATTTATALPNLGSPARRLDFSLPDVLRTSLMYGAPDNDFNCKPSFHPNPVVMLHGLSQNRDDDLNSLQKALNERGYCTYSLTYGAYSLASWVGGVKDMTETAVSIADFIREVLEKTGAEKVDVVGHSEGAVQAIYVPMTQEGISSSVDHVVALAPALHGASYFGIADLWYFAGDVSREIIGAVIDTLGCPACEQMVKDGQIYDYFKDVQKIAQDGNKLTIIMSRTDTLVPPEVSEVHEDGVKLVYVQDTCPNDSVGHFGLSWDKSVWRLITNALEESDDEAFPCEQGFLF
jgi:pimeloyl-ACP methyl ester carboxylesterase